MRDLDTLGLALHRGRLGWSPRGALRWLPYAVRAAIEHAWNLTACVILGHDRILADIPEERGPDGTFHCVHCPGRSGRPTRSGGGWRKGGAEA